MQPRTLLDKIWDAHVVEELPDGTTLLYIDRQLVHEVTSPQAFEGLRLAGRRARRPGAAFAVPDHNVPTIGREQGIADPVSRLQVETLDANCAAFGITEFPMGDIRQGVVHVMGPEEGITLPGMTIVCGDSHTATHGALGSFAFGVGTSEVEHVLATQTILQRKPKAMRVVVTGVLGPGMTAKDVILAVIGTLGTAGGTGFAIEFAGPVVAALSVEGRMTVCNMAIEAGARSGMVAVDATTLSYVKGRPYAPTEGQWPAAAAAWGKLHSDSEAPFDRQVEIDGSRLIPQVTWGTSPEMVTDIAGRVPRLDEARDEVQRAAWEKALAYMGVAEAVPISDLKVDKVFIGSCTNGRIEDLRAAAAVAKGRRVADAIQALVVPGSGLVKQQAEAEGLDRIFTEAGFEWRDPGCSMCLAMNADRLGPKERCASTSNRNFEGRQGRGGRTHLVSPPMAAAAAVTGHFVDVRELVG